MVPTSITSDGSSEISSVSLRMSSAHIPRVTLRTVEPANVLACQSADSRWTRPNALPETAVMILSVNGMIA